MTELKVTDEPTEPPDFASQLRAALAAGGPDVELDLAGMARLPDELAQLQAVHNVSFYSCNELVDIGVLGQPAFGQLKGVAIYGDCKAACAERNHAQASAATRLARREGQAAPPLFLDLSPLRALAGLERLHVHVDQAMDLACLRDLPHLRVLHLTNAWMEDFAPLGSASRLEELELQANGHLQDLDFLGASFPALSSLSISHCAGLCDTSGLAACTALQRLSLNACGVQQLVLPPTMQDLELLALPALERIEGLGAQAHLQMVQIMDCGRLAALPVSGPLPALAELTVCNCAKLESIGPLTGSPPIEAVLLMGNPALAAFPACNELPQLRALYVIDCPLITEIPSLSGSPRMRVLRLEQCKGLQSVPTLRGLAELRELRIVHGKLSQLDTFEGLTGLKLLVLNNLYHLRSLPSMADLVALEVLDLGLCPCIETLDGPVRARGLRVLKLNSCERLEALWPLAGLASLEEIDLTYCHRLRELPDLVGLSELRALEIKKCDALERMGRLEGLPKLHSLKLSSCLRLSTMPDLIDLPQLAHISVQRCGRLQKLGTLRKLPALREVSVSGDNLVTDLSALARFPSLATLELVMCSTVRDIGFVASLPNLQRLVLRKCTGITDLQALAALTQLKSLDLRGTAMLDVSPGALPFANLAALRTLRADQLLGAPSELGSDDDDDILPGIRAWQHDLQASEAPDSVVKIFILGNGSVGKTQLSRRLQGLPFDESVGSTHGIDLGECQILEPEEEYVGVRARLWDFGGQDVYLSTHSLFLDARAIFVVAWNPRYENTDAFEENAIPMRNRPLQYWLEYVHGHVGDAATVLVVQTQCDRQSDMQPPPFVPGRLRRPLVTVASSARRTSGVDALRQALRQAAMQHLETFGKTRMPHSWRKVGAAVAARRHERLMSRKDFDALCASHSPQTPPEVITDYLHNAGEIFCVKSLFDGRVITDLSWMLDGIYALFKRDGVLPVLVQQKGHFSQALLDALFWRDRPGDERNLLMTIMTTCETVIKVADGQFVVPTLLPGPAEAAGEMQTIWQHRTAVDRIRLNYAFLHEGILRRVLHAIGQRAGYRAVYWMYGLCYFDVGGEAIVRISAQLPDIAGGEFGGSIVIEAVPAGTDADRRRVTKGPRALMEDLADAISHINIGRRPTVKIEYSGSEEVTLPDSPVDLAQLTRPGIAQRPAGQPVPVYVSYAWTPESQALVDAIEQRLPAGVNFRRDRNVIQPGDSLTDFMKELSRGSHIIVVLSRDYALRRNCMYELINIHRLCMDEKSDLLNRVIPLFAAGTPDYRQAAQRDPVVAHWQQTYDGLQQMLDRRGFYSIGSNDRNELIMVQDFLRHVSDILAWLSEVLMPRGMAGVDDALALLQRRIAAQPSA